MSGGHEFLRRIQNVLSRGKLNKITDDKTPIAKVELMQNEIYDEMEFPQTWGFTSRPPKDSEVITGHFGGNRDHGTILNVFDKDTYPSEMEDGESMLYNGTNSYVKLKANGDVVIAACKDPADEQDDLKRDLHQPFASITLTKAGVITVNTMDGITINATDSMGASVASVNVDNNGSVNIVGTTGVNVTAPDILLDGNVEVTGNLLVTTINGGPYPPL